MKKIKTFCCLLFVVSLLPVKLSGGHRLRKDKDRMLELQGLPYLACEGVKECSARFCATMVLSYLLDEAISFKKLMMRKNCETDSLSSLSMVFDAFGIDGWSWQRFDDLEMIKRLLEAGKPVILEGFFDTKNGKVETNHVLVYGFCPWGFLVHDPVGAWSGKPENGYIQTTQENIFCGKENLMLFRSLRELIMKQGLLTIGWPIDQILEKKEILNTFKKGIE